MHQDLWPELLWFQFLAGLHTHAPITIKGVRVRPVQMGEEHYNVTCIGAHAADLVEWRGVFVWGSDVVDECSASGAAMGMVCTTGELHIATLHFDAASMDSAGVYSCIQRRAGKLMMVKNVTICLASCKSECTSSYCQLLPNLAINQYSLSLSRLNRAYSWNW